jgi:hypothetical protein
MVQAAVAATNQRVRDNTARHVNRRIEQRTLARLAYFAEHPDEIEERLAELDAEWDVERLIEAEGSTTILTGVVLGVLGHRRWLALPAFATGMLLLHSVQGWYPLLPVFRRFGIRTEGEIAQERYALLALRGDIGGLAADASASARARQALAMAERRPRAAVH